MRTDKSFALLLLSVSWIPSAFSASSSSHFYKKYSDYPEYCSTPQQQAQRSIPPLSQTTPLAAGGTSFTLSHVSTVIRHGARTPWTSHTCWTGYEPNWDCDLMTLVAVPSAAAVSFGHILNDAHNFTSPIEETITQMSGMGATFLFEKRYDAAHSPSDSSHFPAERQNDLGGTCQLGQLILQGYDQSYTNGELLKKAYVNDPDSNYLMGGEAPNAKDKSYILFDLDETKDGTLEQGKRAYQDPKLYFRSDDDQRTIMSGQVLLRGLFGDLLERHMIKEAATTGLIVADNPVIRVHMVDRHKDVLSPNFETCPILEDYEYAAETSEVYTQRFVDSPEAITLNDFMEEQLGGLSMNDPEEAMDCLMTSICSDGDLHYALDDYNSIGDDSIGKKYKTKDGNEGEMFARMASMATQKVSFVHRYNNGQFGKLVSAPLWNEILSDLLPYTEADDVEMHKAWPDLRPPSKLALYSAHDSTLMAMLSSLGSDVWDGKTWPPYASMVLIELYQINFGAEVPEETRSRFPTGTGFRLIFNGDVITHKLSGCLDDEELCDIDELILHVYGFSKPDEWHNTCHKNDFVNDDEVKLDDELDDPEVPMDLIKDGTSSSSSKKSRITFGGVIMYMLSATICAGFGAYMMYLKMGGNPDPRRMFAVRGDDDMNALQLTAVNGGSYEDDSGGRVFGMGAQSIT